MSPCDGAEVDAVGCEVEVVAGAGGVELWGGALGVGLPVNKGGAEYKDPCPDVLGAFEPSLFCICRPGERERAGLMPLPISAAPICPPRSKIGGAGGGTELNSSDMPGSPGFRALVVDKWLSIFYHMRMP